MVQSSNDHNVSVLIPFGAHNKFESEKIVKNCIESQIESCQNQKEENEPMITRNVNDERKEVEFEKDDKSRKSEGEKREPRLKRIMGEENLRKKKKMTKEKPRVRRKITKENANHQRQK